MPETISNKRDVVRLNHGAQISMVRDDCCDVHFEFTGAMAVEQIVQAMVELGHHDQDPGLLLAIVDCPLHFLLRRNLQELILQPLKRGRLHRVAIKAYPDKKSAGEHVVKLLHVRDVAFSRCKKAGNGSHRAHATIAGGVQNVVRLTFKWNVHGISALCCLL